MIGHCAWTPRRKPPRSTLGEVPELAKTNNFKMIHQAKSTGDLSLDEGAWEKTQIEIKRDIAIMIEELSDLINMLGNDVIVAVRRAIW